MNFQVTARKWRPQTFNEIIGQEHLVRALKTAFERQTIPHAYLFSGPRGVGKTTTARILAKALNCTQIKQNYEPCNQCHSCKEITQSHSMDVIEIDGASNRGIDNIREIKDNISFMPLNNRYKIYIIDEVHMLTQEASNALLKTLEEPPEHIIFILATTEPHQVLPTIRSRCQHYHFKKISNQAMIDQLKMICANETIQYHEEGLFEIASAADGSLRDAESLFDQVALYSNWNITEKSVTQIIGKPEFQYYIELNELILNKDIPRSLRKVHQFSSDIGDFHTFTKGFLDFYQKGLLSKTLKYDDELLDISQTRFNQIKKQFDSLSEEEIFRRIQLLIELFNKIKGRQIELFYIEVTLFQLMDADNLISLNDLRSEIKEYLKLFKSQSPQTQSRQQRNMKPNVAPHLSQNIQTESPSSTSSGHQTSSSLTNNQKPTDQQHHSQPVSGQQHTNPVPVSNDPQEIIRYIYDYIKNDRLLKNADLNVRHQSDHLYNIIAAQVHHSELLKKRLKSIENYVNQFSGKPVKININNSDTPSPSQKNTDNTTASAQESSSSTPVTTPEPQTSDHQIIDKKEIQTMESIDNQPTDQTGTSNQFRNSLSKEINNLFQN